jgi:hypothetical protein
MTPKSILSGTPIRSFIHKYVEGGEELIARYTIGLLLMALVSLMTVVAANGVSDAGAPCDGNGIDPAAPVLVMTATTGGSVTVENFGTLKTDIGTGQIVDITTGRVLKTLPFTVILEGNPYTFTRGMGELIPRNFKITYEIGELQAGQKLGLAFNVGYKAKCTVS